MFAENGSFAAMEIQLKKIHQKTQSETEGGGWVTETYLKTEKKWNKPRAQKKLDVQTIFLFPSPF